MRDARHHKAERAFGFDHAGPERSSKKSSEVNAGPVLSPELHCLYEVSSWAWGRIWGSEMQLRSTVSVLDRPVRSIELPSWANGVEQLAVRVREYSSVCVR